MKSPVAAGLFFALSLRNSLCEPTSLDTDSCDGR
jgi:hypothetical protein